LLQIDRKIVILVVVSLGRPAELVLQVEKIFLVAL